MVRAWGTAYLGGVSRDRKPPKRITRQRLRNIALAYVGRYGGSAKRLGEVLRRRVERAHYVHGGDKEEHFGWIQETVESLLASQSLDELMNARSAAMSLHLTGKPERVIVQRLRLKGYTKTSIEAGIERIREHVGDDEDPDLIAACRYARRRGFGPYARPGRVPKERDKQLAAMMRAGFPYRLADLIYKTEDAATLPY